MNSTTLTTSNTSTSLLEAQPAVGSPSPTILEIAAALNAINADPLIERLEAYRPTGRRGYGPRSLWRAYFAGFMLNVASTNDLIRRLQDSAELRLLCGLNSVPSQPTFSRFIARLANHADLVLACINGLTDEFRERLPGFGERVAIDSSIVDAYASPWRKADPDASWTAKRGTDGEPEFHFGYKFHLAVDAVHGVPLAAITTTGGVYDGHYLPPLLEQAEGAHVWYKPQVVTADKGYDSGAVHKAIAAYGAAAVIPLTSLPKGVLPEGPYTMDGQLTCLGGRVMKWVRSDPEKGALFRCPEGGCHLLKRKGVLYCQDEHWEKGDDLRRYTKIPRKTPQWNALYKERQAVERTFKSLKQHRRLAEPYLMGLGKVALHCAISALTYSATMMAQLRSGNVAGMRWAVRRVA